MGPLSGIRVIELGGIGPVPFCGMVLSDMGADVLRVERIAKASPHPNVSEMDAISVGVLSRGRRSIALDLKHPEGLGVALALTDKADVLIEGFRPGVAERLGIGPDICHQRNPRLVYGRITGWGQNGPYAQTAGHDLNYIALAGVLAPIGRSAAPPSPPLNLVADFGGGAMVLAAGVLAALIEAGKSETGQIVDAGMTDGAAYLMTMVYELLAQGKWTEARESNANDGGAHFYTVYETADQRYVSIAAMEPKFYRELLACLGFADQELPDQWDRSQWPIMKQRFADIFKRRTRDEWCQALEGHDVCFAPVLWMSEAPTHPHHAARQSFVRVGGDTVPAPAPRFSRTPSSAQTAPASVAPTSAKTHTDDILGELGFSLQEISTLRETGAIA